MPLDQLLLLLILAATLLLLVWKNLPADLVFTGALTAVILTGIVPVKEALSGFSNEGMLTVAALFIVAAGMRDTGAIQWLTDRLLRGPKTAFNAQSRLLPSVTVLSGFLNNTPIVASFIPALADWSRRFDVPASKLMLPLSYAAILGGTCTMIGTSTNLILNGLLIDTAGISLGLLAPAPIGIPLALAGIAYLLIASRRLLPDRTSNSAATAFGNTREYTIEMVIPIGSPLIGQTIEQAGLRHLSGVYLADITRADRVIAAVDPSERLQADDQLVFVGNVGAVADLQTIAGLQPATRQLFKLDAPRHERLLVEAVVSPSHPLAGLTVREGGFRHRYDSVILSIARNGERLAQKVGDIRLRAGDILLLEAPRDFAKRYRDSNDFLLVSALSQSPAYDTRNAGLAWIILLGLIAVAATGLLSLFQAALAGAFAMILTGGVRLANARRSLDWSVLIVIGASLGLGQAMLSTGLGERIASLVLSPAIDGPLAALIALYLVTWLLTELITNNAAAALIFPVALAVSTSLGADPVPYVMAVLFAASASFSTPIGYQTNLMVMAPGGYRFSDYVRVGLPLNLIAAALSISLIAWWYGV